jgi:nucleolar MIF4G domain-containing protein 1
LYNFQVISCLLVYDLVRKFLEGGLRDEREVELLLKIVRSKSSRLALSHELGGKEEADIWSRSLGQVRESSSDRTTRLL